MRGGVRPLLDAAGYDALLRADFAAFAQRVFHELYPRTRFRMNWHFEVAAARLAAVKDGRTRRLSINLPPRHLKSLLASVAFPAWVLGHRPEAQVVCASYAQDLADKWSRDCRRIVASPWYRRLFPTRLAPARQAMAEFETTAGGGRIATSVGGVLTGRGADLIVVDDPLKPDEALSDPRRRAANEWYDHTLYGRLNDKAKSAVVLVMHRLHEDDLAGHVSAREAWEIVRFPAIAETDERHRIATLAGRLAFLRRRGEALHPAREPMAMLEAIRRTIGEYNFAGQYQQAPAPLGGGMIRPQWFRRYAPDELPAAFDRVVSSWDTANKASELADFSVCIHWGVKGNDLYLVDLVRRRMDYPELKRAVRAEYERRRPAVVLIEDRASGTQLIQELVAEGIYAVTRYRPKGDKVMRMHAQTATIENGFIHLPHAAPWLAEYLHELAVFPNGRYDDQVDATAQFLDWFKSADREDGIYAYYRMRFEESQRKRMAAGAAALPPPASCP
jgi:predicted phage terminase large subunit-like protein